MREILTFASESPYLAFIMFCIACWSAVTIVWLPFQTGLKAYRLAIRGRNIRTGYELPRRE